MTKNSPLVVNAVPSLKDPASNFKQPSDPSPPQALYNEENDEFCYSCGLGGQLVCCDTCPAVYCYECIGYTEEGDDGSDDESDSSWHCPACCCMFCGRSEFVEDKCKPAEVVYTSCDNYVSLKTLKEDRRSSNKLYISQIRDTSKDGVGMKPINGKARQEVKIEGEKGDDLAKSDLQSQQPALMTDPNSNPDPVTGDNGEGDANNSVGQEQFTEIRSCGGDLRAHYGCLLKFSGSADPSKRRWYATAGEEQASRQLAEICARGAMPLCTLEDGTQVAFQLIRPAAAAQTTKTLRGFVPGYTSDQRVELRRILSASLLVLQSAYSVVLDSRTNGDVMAWMLRGGSFASGGTDYSGMHVAVLFANGIVVSVGCVQLLSSTLAQIPLLATRIELQGNRLGEFLLSRIELVLSKLGIENVITPAFILPKYAYMPATMPPQTGPLPPPVQHKAWGYHLASKSQMYDWSRHRHLFRMSGVIFATKSLQQRRNEQTIVGMGPLQPRKWPKQLMLNPGTAIESLMSSLVKLGLVEYATKPPKKPKVVRQREPKEPKAASVAKPAAKKRKSTEGQKTKTALQSGLQDTQITMNGNALVQQLQQRHQWLQWVLAHQRQILLAQQQQQQQQVSQQQVSQQQVSQLSQWPPAGLGQQQQQQQPLLQQHQQQQQPLLHQWAIQHQAIMQHWLAHMQHRGQQQQQGGQRLQLVHHQQPTQVVVARPDCDAAQMNSTQLPPSSQQQVFAGQPFTYTH